MTNLINAIWTEILKSRRSYLPWATAAGFSLAPLAGAFFMIVMRDPEMARRIGIISAKAQIVAGTADWPTYLAFLSQATAVGGIMLFSLVTSWIFGREYSDGTAKDILALPTPRSAIVIGKFFVVMLWSVALTLFVLVVGLTMGVLIDLPPATWSTYPQAVFTLATTCLLTVSLTIPIAFVASIGRGYLPAMGAAILSLVLAQVIAATGWGEYFPWSVPALHAGLAGPALARLSWPSYAVVIATSIAGAIATVVWWERADHVG